MLMHSRSRPDTLLMLPRLWGIWGERTVRCSVAIAKRSIVLYTRSLYALVCGELLLLHHSKRLVIHRASERGEDGQVLTFEKMSSSFALGITYHAVIYTSTFQSALPTPRFIAKVSDFRPTNMEFANDGLVVCQHVLRTFVGDNMAPSASRERDPRLAAEECIVA